MGVEERLCLGMAGESCISLRKGVINLRAYTAWPVNELDRRNHEAPTWA